MREGSSRPGLKQVLWVAAGVVVATFLIVAISWLFSPRPSSVAPGLVTKPIEEGVVKKETFQTETPGPVHEVRPGTVRTEDLPTVAPATPSHPGSETPAKPPAGSAPPQAAPPPPTKVEPKTTPAGPGLPPAPPAGTAARKDAFGIQVGAFSSGANAKDAKRKLESQGFRVALLLSGDKTKVIVTGFADRPAAEKALGSVRKSGFDGAFIVPME